MNYYNEIKNELINNEITKRIKDYSKNRSDLTTYYNVGKLLSEAGKHYGEGIINEYSKKLTSEIGRGYSATRLRYMRQFYLFASKCPSLTDILTYTHYCELIWLEDFNEVEYYIKITIEQNLSVRQLRERIKNKKYERLDEVTKSKLINDVSPTVVDLIKNPIVIKNNNNREIISEKVLQQLILEDILYFLKN